MNEKPLEVLVGELLIARQMTIATAESCTGGLISHLITDVSGSSAYMMGGIVAYSNEAKINLLGVKPETLVAVGAVSEEVAIELAAGVKRVFGVDCALSVTGIAGPLGGTAEKPVGLTYIGLATPDGITVQRFVWEGNRVQNKLSSAQAALQMLIAYLKTG
jgi:PncC family amidohydrolase